MHLTSAQWQSLVKRINAMQWQCEAAMRMAMAWRCDVDFSVILRWQSDGMVWLRILAWRIGKIYCEAKQRIMTAR